MRIQKISYNYSIPAFKNNLQAKNTRAMDGKQDTRIMNEVNFSGVQNVNFTTVSKMTTYAVDLLKQKGLKQGQELYIKGDAKFLPFMEILSKEAYKIGSGFIVLNVIEPEIEALKHKYNVIEEFDYKKMQFQHALDSGALVFEFCDENNPYTSARISDEELKAELEKGVVDVPDEIREIFKAEPKEILKDAMDIHKGQPVFIKGEREHLPLIVKLAEYLYGENQSQLLTVLIANNQYKNFIKFADESLLEYVPESDIAMFKEFYEKDVAWLQLEGSDPKEMEGLDSAKIIKNRQARNLAVEEYHSKTTTNVPWLVYYAPTTKSIKDVYTEFGDDSLKALAKAYEDANKINRMGSLEQHVQALDYRATKMNELLQNGYRTLHYVSVDKDTKLPDGKTDFKITMSPSSETEIFSAVII